MNKFDLEERLAEFTVLIIEITKEVPNNNVGNHLSKSHKIAGLRSGTSVSRKYGNAQSDELRKDFVHKMKIVQKELRENFIYLKIFERTKIFKTQAKGRKSKTRK